MKKIGRKAKYLALALAAALLVSLTPAALTTAQASDVYTGIDVSEWQGDIDWQSVANSGVQFAMVRVMNSDRLDYCYLENIVEANAAGIRVGAYCYSYATTVEQAAADAATMVAVCESLPISFPVAIDMEAKVQESLTAQEQQAIVNTFCSIVYAAGYTPMVYASKDWFQTRLGLTIWDQWVASWYTSEAGYPATMWQYSAKGTVSGISGDVDLDYTLKDFVNLIPCVGLVQEDGATYYYYNYRKQFGLQTVGDLMYWFDSTTGAMLYDLTVTDEAGNITRVCKDGHVVIITAEMQLAAAQALLEAQTQQALLVQCQEAQAAYEAAADDALGQYTAFHAAVEEYAATVTALAEVASILPTEENLAALAAAQAQYEQYLETENAALVNYQTLQTAAQAAAVQTTAQEVTAAQAQAASDAAQLTVVIPE